MSTPSSHVNIDGDVINYSVGYACQSTLHCIDGKQFEEKEDALSYCERYDLDPEELTKKHVAEPIAHCLSSVKRLINRIVKSSKATTYTVLLTGDGNFREEVATIQPYKGNRLNDDGSSKQPKPVLFQEIRDYLLFVQNAELIEGEEADDQLSIRAVEQGHTIATIDKDLNNTAGWHYNWQRDELYEVNEIDANRNFYLQLFSGDATDHIPGLYRITGKRASPKMKAPIKEMTDPYEMYQHIWQCYVDAFLGDVTDPDDYEISDAWSHADDVLTEIGRLLWMRREEGEIWNPPTSK